MTEPVRLAGLAGLRAPAGRCMALQVVTRPHSQALLLVASPAPRREPPRVLELLDVESASPSATSAAAPAQAAISTPPAVIAVVTPAEATQLRGGGGRGLSAF